MNYETVVNLLLACRPRAEHPTLVELQEVAEDIAEQVALLELTLEDPNHE